MQKDLYEIALPLMDQMSSEGEHLMENVVLTAIAVQMVRQNEKDLPKEIVDQANKIYNKLFRCLKNEYDAIVKMHESLEASTSEGADIFMHKVKQLLQ